MFIHLDKLIFLEFKRYGKKEEEVECHISDEITHKLHMKAAETAYLYRRCLSKRDEFKSLGIEFWVVLDSRIFLKSKYKENAKEPGSVEDSLKRFGKSDVDDNKMYFDDVKMYTTDEFEEKMKGL